jgi:uncharacterized OB-fold protein
MTEHGEVYTFSVVNSTTEAFKERAPYIVAVVIRSDGTRVVTLLEGYSPDKTIQIGAPVHLKHHDRLGNPVYVLD